MSKKPIFKQFLFILALFAGAIAAYLNLQADKIIYYKYGKAYWQHSQAIVCDDYRKGYFQDLRPGASAQAVLDLSCEQALTLAAESRFATSSDGLKIHYKVFTAPTDLPILLHVSGITSTWLNGARYVKASERMGFQLMSLEMRNHGLSQNNAQGVAYGCKEKSDVLAVLADIQKTYPARPILLWGSSGGSMSILNAAAAHDPAFASVKALMIESPSSSLRDVAESKSPGLPGFLYDTVIALASWRTGNPLMACAATAQARHISLPTRVIGAEKDTLTPPWMAQKVYQALPKQLAQLTIYPHGKHEAVWNGQPESYEADVKRFWQTAFYAQK